MRKPEVFDTVVWEERVDVDMVANHVGEIEEVRSREVVVRYPYGRKQKMVEKRMPIEALTWNGEVWEY